MIAKMKDTLGKSLHFYASGVECIHMHVLPNHRTRRGDGRHMADKGQSSKKVDGRVLRGRRLFSVLAIFEAKVTADLVSGLAMPPQKPARWRGVPPLIGMRPMIGSARLLKLSKDRPTSPACSYWWRGSTRGGSRFRLMQTKTDCLGSSPCRSMKSGWQDPLLFCPRQICFRSSTKSASKLGLAQTTPDRAKSRNAGAFSRVTTWESSAARVGP